MPQTFSKAVGFVKGQTEFVKCAGDPSAIQLCGGVFRKSPCADSKQDAE
jgi:hypothetical protein